MQPRPVLGGTRHAFSRAYLRPDALRFTARATRHIPAAIPHTYAQHGLQARGPFTLGTRLPDRRIFRRDVSSSAMDSGGGDIFRDFKREVEMQSTRLDDSVRDRVEDAIDALGYALMEKRILPSYHTA